MVSRQIALNSKDENINRIRSHLQQRSTQERIQKYMQDARNRATVTTSRAAGMFGFGEQQLRDWEKRKLISTQRVSTSSPEDGKQTLGHRQFNLDELDKLAIIKELISGGGFSSGEIPAMVDVIWREVIATEEQKTPTVSQDEEVVAEAELPIDRHIKVGRAKLFWRFYVSHALRLSLMLIGEDMPRETIGLLLPLQPDVAHLPVTHIENMHLLGESLVGWLGHSRSSHTMLTRSPHFSFNSDFRIHPLLVMETNRLIEESSSEHTHIIMPREARALTLKPEVVETIRALLKPLYEDVEQVRACFGQDMFDVLEPSPDLDNTTMYPDSILDKLADMIVNLGDSEQGKQRWLFCCILLTRDPSRPLQQRTLVVRAQSQASPHKVGVASVSPNVEMSSLSLRAYQSGQICYRDTVSPEDTVIAFHDVEHNIQSAIAIPVGAEYGEPVAVIYVASEFDRAFSEAQDQRLLRLLGRMVGEVIKSYQTRRQEVERLGLILNHPEVVDDVMGAFNSENKFIHELGSELLLFEAGRQQWERLVSEPATSDEHLVEVQQEKYALAFIGVDVDHSSSLAAKYGNNAIRNLYREIAQRIKSELASTFRMYPESKFYHIYADRFVVVLKNITHEQLISKARLLKKSLDVAYKISLLSTQQPPPVHLEELKITVRLAVSAYTINTLERLFDEYRGQNSINQVHEAIERSLATELKKGMSDGGNQIRAWNPAIRLYERLGKD
jgi:GGDEF domain-containing protein/DNA-binding transcriptional MerR regulator